MNLSEMIEVVQNYLDDPYGRRHKRPFVVRLLNAAQDDVKRLAEAADESYFSGIAAYSVVSADDSLEFDLPADFSSAISVERTDGTYPVMASLVPFAMRFPTVDDRFLPAGAKTIPQYYFRGSKIGIVRPRDAYTLRLVYSKTLARLKDDADVPEVHLDYHDLICIAAAKRGFAIENRRMPQDLEDLRQDAITDLRSSLEERANNGPTFVNVLE